MTRERLEELKAKIYGPDVAALIAEVERVWALLDRLVEIATADGIEQSYQSAAVGTARPELGFVTCDPCRHESESTSGRIWRGSNDETAG